MNYKSNVEDILKDVNSLDNKTIKAIYRAKNKATAKAKTESKKIIQEVYNIKAKDVSKAIKIKKANSGDLETNIKFVSHTTPIVAPMLKSLQPLRGKRKNRLGKFRDQKIKVLIKKGSPKTLSAGVYKPFLMRVNAGGTSKMIIAKRKSKKRYGTSQVRTVPVAKMAGNTKVSDKLKSTWEQTYHKEFNRLMELKNV